MIIDSLKSFFEECPLLKEGKINVNYLGGCGGEYSIESIPAKPVLKRYVDGGEVRQYAFIFASREFYGEDAPCNTEAARFYEELGAWIEQQSETGHLPAMDGGLTAEGLEVTSSGFVYSSDASTARLQLECRLIYRKRGKTNGNGKKMR